MRQKIESSRSSQWCSKKSDITNVATYYYSLPFLAGSKNQFYPLIFNGITQAINHATQIDNITNINDVFRFSGDCPSNLGEGEHQVIASWMILKGELDVTLTEPATKFQIFACILPTSRNNLSLRLDVVVKSGVSKMRW